LTGIEGIEGMKMKIALISMLVFAFSGIGFGQVDKQVTGIRAEVAAINKAAKGYKKKVKTVEGVSLEGTEASYFTSRTGELKKITAKMYGETYNASAELYYQGDELIFYYIKTNKYNGHIAMKPAPKVASVEEERYYFENTELVRLVHGKVELKPGDEKYDELKNRALELAKTLQDAF
jgi:hypothetical protein